MAYVQQFLELCLEQLSVYLWFALFDCTKQIKSSYLSDSDQVQVIIKSVASDVWVIALKEEEEDETLKPVDSSHYDLHLLGSLQMHEDDDEELQMLASLKREQEEDECRALGLSESQIHQCNVSISMSSDDTSTWTHMTMVCTVILCYFSFFLLYATYMHFIYELQLFVGFSSSTSGILFVTPADPYSW